MLFARYDELRFPEEHFEHLRTLAESASPWYDDARGRWLVFDGAQMQAVLSHSAWTNDLSRATANTRSTALRRRLSPEPPSLLFTEPPLHTAVKEAAAPWFRASPIAVVAADFGAGLERALREELEARRAFDLGDIVFPLLVTATFQTLELCAEVDSRSLISDAFAVNRLFDLECSDDAYETGLEARVRLRALARRCLDAHNARGSGVGAAWSAAGVPHEVQISTIEFMLRAGVVTNGCLLLNAFCFREDWPSRCELDANPGRALESLLAAASPVLDTGRVATRRLELGDSSIPAGDTIICLLAAAVHPHRHRGSLVFGGGRHVCLGRSLVRAELRAFVDNVMRLDGLRLRTSCSPRLHCTPSFRGICGLDVSAA